MISTLGSALKTGIMTSLTRKEVKKLKINLAWKTDHLEDEDFEAMRHSAEYRDHSKEQCLDHRHRHQCMMLHQCMTLKDRQHFLLRSCNIEQAMHRLFVAYNQCVTRVANTDDRLEQFRSTIRRDALDIALTVQRAGQDIQHQQQAIEHIKSTLFEDVQERVKSLEERLRSVMDHEVHVNQTIDRNTHWQCASISALISEQGDVRKLVEEVANRRDQSQEASSATQSEVSTNALLEISDLKSKVLRLTEQSTNLDGDLSFLSKLSEQVELLEDQIIKWRYRLPELTDDESKERIVSTVEVREELDEFKEVVLRKLKEFLTNLNTLQESSVD